MNSRDQFLYGDQMNKQQECTVNNQQAKQIATVKWLLQKAYDNNVPEYLKEPFYFDKRQQPQNVTMSSKNCSIHLKHNVVNVLSNAELYCQALANIYLDPNFLNLNHTGIIQTLARKGVTLSDPQLTETVLLQTNPLKLTAHLCVIEAIMMLYAKEIATPDRIFAAIRKFTTPQQQCQNDFNSNSVIQQWNVSDYDQLLLLWISEAVSALNKRIKQSQSEINEVHVPENEFFKPPGRELTELCDGVSLCALISFYCPQSLPWKNIRVGKPTNTAECIHNLNLFASFCQNSLPYQIFHMLPQDILPHSIGYMRPNLLALLADLFNLLEVRPVNESTSSSALSPQQMFSEQKITEKFESAFGRKNGHTTLQKRTLTATQQICAIPNLRNYSNAQNGGFNTDSRGSNSSPKFDRKPRNGSNPSDSQNNSEFFVVHKGRNIPTLSSMNIDICQKEKQHETVAAGKPSNWNDTRKNQLTGCGRRSRRNSFSEESQLTIENFGGSQENINMLGRNPDKEPAVHVVNVSSDNVSETNEAGRQSRLVAAQENRSSAAITSLLCDNTTDESLAVVKTSNIGEIDNTSNIAASAVSNATSSGPTQETAVMLESCKVSSQMLNIRLKLEEKRRKIENEKRRLEINLKRQRQKLNNAAFLQAVSKIEKKANGTDLRVDNFVSDFNAVGNGFAGDGDKFGDGNGDGDSRETDIDASNCDSIVTSKDISQVEERWLKTDFRDNFNNESSKFDGETADIENIDIEKCQQSISEMNTSLHAIQSDLQWLSSKEKEMFQAPVHVNADFEAPKMYPVPFAVSPDQTQLFQKNIRASNPAALNRDVYQNAVGYNLENAHGAYATLPNKNIPDYIFAGPPHPPHHLSLLENVPMKSPPSSPRSQMLLTFDSRPTDGYGYQAQQPEPMFLHSHTPPSSNKYNYHSMNAVNDNITKHASPVTAIPKDKENHQLQNQNEHFYLHKPYDVPSSHIQPSHNVNLASITNTTFAAGRKTWDNRESSFSQPTPPPRTFASRFSSSTKDSVSLSRAFTENKLKTSASFANSSVSEPHGFSRLKKSFSSHNASEQNHSHSNVSETDAAYPSRQSAGGHSIPTPPVDDMEPQCISFIGSQQDSIVGESTAKKQLNENVNKLNIVNGNRTYRIPSPTNKTHSRPSSQSPFVVEESQNARGFYVSFSPDDDDECENKPRFNERNTIKPPFRAKRFTASLTKNDKLKNGSYKKPEIIRKPEIIYDKSKEAKETCNSPLLSDNSRPSDGKIVENHSENTIIIKSRNNGAASNSPVGLVINSDVDSHDPALVDEMERKKERILLQSLQRRQQQEEMKARKEIELQRRKEQEKQKEEIKAKKKEEEKRRRAIILEKHRLKKMIEEAEREGKPIDKDLLNAMMNMSLKSNNVNGENSPHNAPVPKLRSKKLPLTNRPRPKTIHIDVGSNLKENIGGSNLLANLPKKGSIMNLAEHNNNNNHNHNNHNSNNNSNNHNHNYGMNRRDYYRGSQDCLLTGTDVTNTAGTSASSIYSDLTDEDRAVSASYQVNGSTCGSIGRRRGSSYKNSRDVSLDRATSRIARPKFSSYYQNYPRKSSSLMNLCGSSCDQDSFTYNSRYMADTDSVLGRATPPHRTSSPAPNNSSPSGPGSLPPSHHSRRLRYDDTASESGGSEYSGLRLYKQPAVKSNRGIIMNAVEYCVFPGVVNRDAKNRILEEISRSDSTNTKHFLILFRDARYQFRALYSYFPENEEVMKVYGTGPKQVTEKMFDKFFKYNSGGKCFTQVHTKHLTVTIDAFTIHNSLWQGKKVNLPNKRDMTLVI